jgi:TolA-binding protein
MRRTRLLAAASLWLCGSGWAAAAQSQPRPDDQARRLLDDGRTDLASGRAKQGLDALETIVSGFPNSSYADDALLEIGRYAEEVEKDLPRARDLYDQIAKKYPQSDAAPVAYLRMGRLAFATAASQAALDDALANFQRVIRLYPESPSVPGALVASAAVFRRAGKFDSAIDAARRAVLDHPSSEVAPEAQFEIGQSMAMAGDPLRGLEEFQRARTMYAESPAAARALNATTALYRIYGGDRPVFLKDAAYSLPGGDALKDVRSLAVTADGTTWIASNKTKSAVAFDRDFRLSRSLPADDPQTLTTSPEGEVVFAARLAIKVGATGVFSFSGPSSKPGVMEPIDRIGAATILVSGDTLVSDLRRKRVLRFRSTAFVSAFPDGEEREVIKLLTTPRGDVVMLRKDNKSVEIFDDGGRLISKIGPRGQGFEWKKPADVAVDAFSNLYLADEDQGVFMFSPKGDLMTTFGGADVRKSRAIAIDLTGAPLVYDDRAETVVRFK